MDESGSSKEDAEAIEKTLDVMSGDNSATPAPVDSTSESRPENNAVERRLSNTFTAPRMRRVRRVALNFELGNNVDLHTDHSKDARTSSSAVFLTETSSASWADAPGTDSQPDTLNDFSSTISMNSQSASPIDSQLATATTSQPSESAADVPQAPVGAPIPLPTNPPTGLVPTPPDGTHSSDHIVFGTPVPAQAPVKTGPPKASCTPSPTSSLVPTASEYSSLPIQL